MRHATVDRVMCEARAASFSTRSIKGPAKAAALRMAIGLADLTTLEGQDTPGKVRALARKAVDPGDGWSPSGPAGEEPLPPVAALCVYPTLVRDARRALDALGPRGRGVHVASVATGFPSGQYPLTVRLDDARRAIDAGADELDMVISRGALLAGRTGEVAREVGALARLCLEHRPGPEPRVHLKVILETGELGSYDRVRQASELAIASMHDAGLTRFAGAGFIKTSTGKVEPAATMPVTLVMLETIRDHADATGELVGMKPAGGIRTAKQAVHYLVMVAETMTGVGTGAGGGVGTGVGVDEARADAGDAPGAHSGPAASALATPYLTPRLFRFGASALVNDLVRQLRWLAGGRYAARYDCAEA